MTEDGNGEEVFRQLGQNAEKPIEIESLCMNCQKNGMTKLLMIDVPYFKKIVVSSFLCDYCGNKNEHIQSVEPCAAKGVYYELKLKNKEDLTRFVVRQETASVIIPKLEFESPPVNGKSCVTPIEGLIEGFIEGLNAAIDNHKEEFKQIADQLEVVKNSMSQLLENFEPFTLIVDDPSGNSFIENIHAPTPDPDLIVRHYVRNREQNLLCGIYSNKANDEYTDIEKHSDEVNAKNDNENSSDDSNEFARYCIDTNCMYCRSPVSMRTQKFSIPYFKDVLIFNYNCENCGYKTNEVKSAGAIEPKGTLMTLSVENTDDISRDILKSDFCDVKIPELGIELPAGTLGSSYMTLEALLEAIKDQLVKANPFSVGDTARKDAQKRMSSVVENIDLVIEGKKKITFIMNDPTGNSFIQVAFLRTYLLLMMILN